MTEAEVELIYNYLHENYEYRDGELIAKNNRFGHKIGSRLGSVSYGNNVIAPCIKSIIVINKRRFASTLAQFVFIYHYKKHTQYLQYLDDNKMNTKIENIFPADIKNVYLQKFQDARGFVPVETSLGVRYRVIVTNEYKSLYLGKYKTEDQAYNVYRYSKELFAQGFTEIREIKEKLMQKFDYCVFRKSPNKFGFPGLSQSYEKYFYRIRRKGEVIKSKLYDTPEEAHAAYLKAKEEIK